MNAKNSLSGHVGNTEKYDDRKVYDCFRVILFSDVQYGVEDYDVSGDEEIAILSKSVKSSTNNFDDWFVRDSMKTCTFIAENYPRRYLHTLFTVKLSVLFTSDSNSEKFITVTPIQWTGSWYFCASKGFSLKRTMSTRNRLTCILAMILREAVTQTTSKNH